jgi:hypothetical protein
MTKAAMTLAMASRPGLEFIIETDANYEAVAKLAGAKPEHYIQSTEDYGNASE